MLSLVELLTVTPVPLVDPEPPAPDLPQADEILSKVPPLAIPSPNMLPTGHVKQGLVNVPTIYIYTIFYICKL